MLALSERDNRRDGDFGKRIVSNVAAQPPNKRGWAMATQSTILQLLSKGPLAMAAVSHLPRRAPVGFAAGAGFLVGGEGSGEVAGFVLSFCESGKR